MVDTSADDKKYYVPKKLLGELMRMVITSTDPANILGFTAVTISSTRALMIRMLESQIPKPEIINTTLIALLTRVIESWDANNTITKEEAEEIEKMLMTTFKSESLMKYDLELYRDIIFCEDMYANWKVANNTYILDKHAWSQSNEIISEIHKLLFEIIIRHNLMVMPYGDSFNLDQHGTNTSQIQSILAKIAAASGEE